MEEIKKRQSLYFTGKRTVSVKEETLPMMNFDQVLVQTMISAISSGTELLIYRGAAPEELPTDETIRALSGKLTFPLKYGYSVVGRVIKTGAAVDPSWLNKTIFSFHPHENLFNATLDEIIDIPEDIMPDDAVFMPNMETALTLVMDGQPMIGEQVVVCGQGIVGLLLTALLAQFPLGRLITLDYYERRRRISVSLGAHASLDSAEPNVLEHIRSELNATGMHQGAELVYEVSGNPDALNQAIAVAGYNGRIVIGSWYGTKIANLNLGVGFHRSRIKLMASQVSTIAPRFTGQWTSSRRIWQAWNMLRVIRPSGHFITHRIPFTDAATAYELIDKSPDNTLQVILTFGS